MKYFRFLLSILCFSALFTGFSTEASALDVSAGAGVFIHTGTNASKYDPGVTMNVTVKHNIAPLVDFRVSGIYSHASGKSGGSDYEFNSYGAQAMAFVTPPMAVVKPYVGAGYGLYYNSHKVSGNINRDKDKIGHGPVVQAGVDFHFTAFRVGVDAKYMGNMAGNDNNYSGWSVGVNAGLSF